MVGLGLARPLVPPIAPPVGPFAVAASFVGQSAHGALAPALASLTRCGAARTYESGRAALARLLAAHVTPQRSDVVMPAYTCWSVPSSVVRAGGRVRLIDVDPVTCTPDLDAIARLPFERIAAIVLPHLLGRSFDISSIRRIVPRDGAPVLVEDAAQWWPGAADGAGGVRLLSFGRGKPLALGGGGALLFDEATTAIAPDPPARSSRGALAFLLAMLASRPALFRLAAGIPWLGVGRTIYDPSFPLGRGLAAWQERLGVRLLPSLPELTRNRTANARRIAEAVLSVPLWSVAAPGLAEGPLRVPVLAPDRDRRDRVLARLRALGVGASSLYPGTLLSIPALSPHLAHDARNGDGRSFPGAQALADRLLTLPCYPGLSEPGLSRVAAAFLRASAEVA